jgi:hypothetical protein
LTLDSRSDLSFSNLQDQDNLSNLGQIMAGHLISCVQGRGWRTQLPQSIVDFKNRINS